VAGAREVQILQRLSKFFTPIPVDVESVTKLIGQAGTRAFIGEVRWNPEFSRIEVHWETDLLRTGRDYPIEFDPGTDRLPEGVECVRKKPKAQLELGPVSQKVLADGHRKETKAEPEVQQEQTEETEGEPVRTVEENAVPVRGGRRGKGQAAK